MAAQRLVRRAPIGERVVEAILDLVRAGAARRGRPGNDRGDRLGPGPARRASADARALAPARWSTAGSRHRSTTSRRWPTRRSSIAWR